jgi:aspartate/methionine/tyrosine aminotransferase
MEMINIDPSVQAELYKLASSGLCSGLPGQMMTSLMTNEPKPGDFSYESHEAEKAAIFEGLKARSRMVVEKFNAIDGFACQESEGAMYCFPSIKLPPNAIIAAKAEKMSPDSLYAISLLKATGICVVPASGFGQEEGRFGFRTTFLPPMGDMEDAMKLFKSHHEAFVAKYK